MTKFEIFRRQASIGAHVTLRLTRGNDITGRVAELDDTYIRLSVVAQMLTPLQARHLGPATTKVLLGTVLRSQDAGSTHVSTGIVSIPART